VSLVKPVLPVKKEARVRSPRSVVCEEMMGKPIARPKTPGFGDVHLCSEVENDEATSDRKGGGTVFGKFAGERRKKDSVLRHQGKGRA